MVLCFQKATIVHPVTDVHFDLTSLLVAQAQNAVIVETKGITRCLLNEVTKKDGSKETVLNTEGINMQEIFKHGDVSVDSKESHGSFTYSNTL